MTCPNCGGPTLFRMEPRYLDLWLCDGCTCVYEEDLEGDITLMPIRFVDVTEETSDAASQPRDDPPRPD